MENPMDEKIEYTKFLDFATKCATREMRIKLCIEYLNKYASGQSVPLPDGKMQYGVFTFGAEPDSSLGYKVEQVHSVVIGDKAKAFNIERHTLTFNHRSLEWVNPEWNDGLIDNLIKETKKYSETLASKIMESGALKLETALSLNDMSTAYSLTCHVLNQKKVPQ